MSVLRPSATRIQELGASLGIELSPEDANLYHRMMEGTFEAYDLVNGMPDNIPPVTYARTPGYRPEPQENRLIAWARKVSIVGKQPGPLSG